MAQRYKSDVWDTLVIDPMVEAFAELADRCERQWGDWKDYVEAYYHKDWSRRDVYEEWKEIVEDLGLESILFLDEDQHHLNKAYL